MTAEATGLPAPAALAPKLEETAGSKSGSGRVRHGYLASRRRRENPPTAPIRSPSFSFGTSRPPLSKARVAAVVAVIVALWLFVALFVRYTSPRHSLRQDLGMNGPSPWSSSQPEDETNCAAGEDNFVDDSPVARRRQVVRRAPRPEVVRPPAIQPPATITQLPGLSAAVAHASALQSLAAGTKKGSVADVFMLRPSELVTRHDDSGQAFVSFDKGDSDVRPFVVSYTARFGDDTPKMQLEFIGEKLYSITVYSRDKEPWIPTMQRHMGSPARRVDYPDGGSLADWKLPAGTLRVYTSEPGGRDRQWSLYPGTQASLHEEAEAKIFAAFALNDAAMALPHGRRAKRGELDAGVKLFERALALVPHYGRARLRLCRLHKRRRSRGGMRTHCTLALRSVFPDVQRGAAKILKRIR